MGNTLEISYNKLQIYKWFEYRILKKVQYSIPTLKLLSASLVVAFSGGCRIYIAFLLLNIAPDLIVYLAGSLVVYATYTIDRSIECEEDKINRKELASANKKIGIFVGLIALFTGAYFLSRYDLLFIAFFPLLMGYIYSPGLCFRNYRFKLKGPLGVKNLVVALTWGVFIISIAQHWSRDITALFLIFTFFTIKIFGYTVINDIKDIKGDSLAGLKTLPIYWGEKKTKIILQILHHSLHIVIFITMLLNCITSQFIILFTCWTLGLIYTSYLTKVLKVKMARDILVIGEFILAVCFKIGLDELYEHVV